MNDSTDDMIDAVMTSEEVGQRRGSLRLVVTLLIFVGIFYSLVLSMTQGGAYFLTVDEVQAAQENGKLTVGRKVRIKGKVAYGSYENTQGSSEHRFVVEGEQHRVKVYFKGPIPDVFQEGGEVVATGRFSSDNLLKATEVTAKCPSKYEQGDISPETRKHLLKHED